jgi:hypothetical protein
MNEQPHIVEGKPASLMLFLGFMVVAVVFFASWLLKGKSVSILYGQLLLAASAIFVVIAFASLTQKSRLNVASGKIERRFLNIPLKAYLFNHFSKVDRVLKCIGETDLDYRIDVVLISRYAKTPCFIFSSYYFSAPSDEEALAHPLSMVVAKQLAEAMKLEA